MLIFISSTKGLAWKQKKAFHLLQRKRINIYIVASPMQFAKTNIFFVQEIWHQCFFPVNVYSAAHHTEFHNFFFRRIFLSIFISGLAHKTASLAGYGDESKLLDFSSYQRHWRFAVLATDWGFLQSTECFCRYWQGCILSPFFKVHPHEEFHHIAVLPSSAPLWPKVIALFEFLKSFHAAPVKLNHA